MEEPAGHTLPEFEADIRARDVGAGANRCYFKALEVWKLPGRIQRRGPGPSRMEEEPAKEAEQG